MKKIFGLGFYTFCIVALFVILYFSQGQSYEGFGRSNGEYHDFSALRKHNKSVSEYKKPYTKPYKK